MALAAEPMSLLPRRPRVLPGLAVLRRGARDVQIGIDPKHGVLVDGLDEHLMALLAAIDGRLTVPELLELAGPDEDDKQTAIALLTSLAEAGLLDDASPRDGIGVDAPARLSADATAWALRTGNPRRRMAGYRGQAAVLVQGEGRLGVALACLLAAAGIGWIDFAAAGKVRAEDTGTGYLDSDVSRPRGEAGVEAVHRAVSGIRTGTLPTIRRPDLAVLTDHVIASPSVIAPLHAEGVPHLIVRMRDGTGVIGPLVVPGRTSCLHCVELHRTDLDPAWPAVAVQLAGRPQAADLTCAQATAGVAAAQVLLALEWWLTGEGSPVLWNTSLEIDAFRGTITSRGWQPHPDCRCGAARGEEASV
jgi:bacteriocin biosynthesis cyclodehydratase domain-containing protein